jgi:hypothetical protein
LLELGLKGIAGTLMDRPRRVRIVLIGIDWRSGSSDLRRRHRLDRTKGMR